MHSVVLSLTSNDNLSNPTLLVLSPLDFWWELGNTIGHPTPGVDVLGHGHRIFEPFATGLRVPGHLGNAIGRPGLGHLLRLFLTDDQRRVFILSRCGQRENTFSLW